MEAELIIAIKQVYESVVPSVNNKTIKINAKTLSDGYIFMQILQRVEETYFNSSDLKKPLNIQQKVSSAQQKSLFLLGRAFLSINQPQVTSFQSNQLNLPQKVKNWKTLLNQIKYFFSSSQQKGIKYDDIDVIQLSKTNQVKEISKILELVLCVVVNSKDKEIYIDKIMNMTNDTQELLAELIGRSMENRLCSLQDQQKNQLSQQIKFKNQQNFSLYEQIDRLTNLNIELQQKVEVFNQMAQGLAYQRKKIQIYKKNIIKNSINQQGLQQDNKIACSPVTNQFSSLIQQQNLLISHEPHPNILIQSLKQRILRSQQQYQSQIQQLEDRIFELQQKLKQASHFQELLFIYQEKYQQALNYVEKVSTYQKQKNKVNQEIIQKDLLVDQLKEQCQTLNTRIVQLEQEKIDLQLILARKNTHKRQDSAHKNKKNRNINHRSSQNDKLAQPKPDIQLNQNFCSAVDTFNIPKSKLGKIQIQTSFKQLIKKQNRAQLSMYPLVLQQQNQCQNQQLYMKVQNLSLDLKRIERRQKQLCKQNVSLKLKLQKMTKIQSENKKLSNIIVQLHTQKDQELEVVIGAVYQTYKDFQYKCKKLLTNECQQQRKSINKQSMSLLCNNDKQNKNVDLNNLKSFHQISNSSPKIQIANIKPAGNTRAKRVSHFKAMQFLNTFKIQEEGSQTSQMQSQKQIKRWKFENTY